MSLATYVQSELRRAARMVHAHSSDLCIVARPDLACELHKVGIRVEAVPHLLAHAMGEGRFASDMHIIMRCDLWAWRGRGMRAKILRNIAR